MRGSSISEPPATGNELTCTYDRLVDELDVGDRVMMADGAVSMLVAEKHDDRVACKVIASGVISSRQGVNLPGAKLSVPALTDKDREDVVWAAQQEIDFVSLSFVRRAEDLIELRELLRRHACEPWLVAKIEKGEALDDLDRIVQHADAVMVARGDLGIEIDVTQTRSLRRRSSVSVENTEGPSLSPRRCSTACIVLRDRREPKRPTSPTRFSTAPTLACCPAKPRSDDFQLRP